MAKILAKINPIEVSTLFIFTANKVSTDENVTFQGASNSHKFEVLLEKSYSILTFLSEIVDSKFNSFPTNWDGFLFEWFRTHALNL